MTRENFVKHRFRAYEIVRYKNDRMRNWDDGLGIDIECMVCSVNFDEETMLLQPLQDILTVREFVAHIQNIEFPRRKLKIVRNKINREKG